MSDLDSLKIVEMLKNEGVDTTINIETAIFILPNGEMISGGYERGIRGTDHSIIEILFDDIDRYDDRFWEEVVLRTGLVQYVPETKVALVKEGQVLTEQQRIILNNQCVSIEYY